MSEQQALGFLAGGGRTGELIGQFDWSTTPLGSITAWPEAMRAVIGLVLRSPVPMATLWGVEGVMVYNDAYMTFAGDRHPALLGAKVREGWAEIADFNDNVMKVGLAGDVKGALLQQPIARTAAIICRALPYRRSRPAL